MASGAGRGTAIAVGAVLVAGVVVALGWAVLRDGGSPSSDGNGNGSADGGGSAAGLDVSPGEEATVRGEVVENSIDPCVLPDQGEPCVDDAGHYLVLDVDGTQVRVHYGGGEWPPCDNVDALRQGEAARVGSAVEVFAEGAADDHPVGADLDTCGDPDYHILMLE